MFLLRQRATSADLRRISVPPGEKRSQAHIRDKIRYGKYLMTLARHEGRKMRALAILRYNGLKNISNGEVLFLPLTDKKSSTFRVEKCRIVMNEQAKMINKLTIKRR